MVCFVIKPQKPNKHAFFISSLTWSFVKFKEPSFLAFSSSHFTSVKFKTIFLFFCTLSWSFTRDQLQLNKLTKDAGSRCSTNFEKYSFRTGYASDRKVPGPNYCFPFSCWNFWQFFCNYFFVTNFFCTLPFTNLPDQPNWLTGVGARNDTASKKQKN